MTRPFGVDSSGLGAVVLWICLWAVYDILIVERYLKPVNVWAHPGYRRFGRYLDVYIFATWFMLFPITTVSVFGFSRAALLAFILLVTGWEDLFYYWLQGKSVPRTITWLPFTPTNTALYIRAAGGVVLTVWLVRGT